MVSTGELSEDAAALPSNDGHYTLIFETKKVEVHVLDPRNDRGD
jgi:hypothetical protein